MMMKKNPLTDPRHLALFDETRITPMHHHEESKDFLVSHADDGSSRAVSRPEAAALVAAGTDVVPTEHLARTVGRRGLLSGALGKATVAGLASVAAMSAPMVAPRMAFAAGANPKADLLVVGFLRGGVDMLSAVVPVTDSAYYDARPSIKVPASDTIVLNPTYGLNKHMGALKPLWDAKQLAFVVGTGNKSLTRSHFEDQILCEQADTAPAAMRTGWLARHITTSSSSQGTFRVVSMGTKVAASVASNAYNTIAMSSVDEFDLFGWDGYKAGMSRTIDSLFASAGGTAAANAHTTLTAIDELARVRDVAYTPGATYPAHRFAAGLRDIARMAKGGIGLEAATVDFGDWDMHNKLGSSANETDWFSRNSRTLAQSLAAFAQDLGPLWARTTVVLMSEFGRRVVENGGGGLDHGHGSTMIVLGGGINGGVYGSMPSLKPANLVMGDVPITTDYRRVLSEVVSKRLANGANLAKVFPGYTQETPLGIARPVV